MSRASEILKEISALQVGLNGLQPYEKLSVRQLARKAGISPATASRLKNGKTMDVPTIQKLIETGCVRTCLCCGQDTT